MSTSAPGRKIALAIVIAAYVLSFFHRFAPAGIAADLAATFQTTAASLGVLAATYFYIYTLMQVPTGVLVDTLGPRRILTVGSLLAASGSLLFAMAPDLTIAMIGRTLIGLGVSVVFIAMLKLIAVWFDERRFATMVGLAMLVGNTGSVLAGTPLAAVAEIVSWRMVFVGVAGLSLLLAAGSWLLIREDAGSGSDRPRFDRTVIMTALAGVLKNRETWPPVIVNFGLTGSFFTFGGLWLTPYLSRIHGMAAVTAAGHLSLYFAGFAVGCLMVGSLSDRLGRRKPVLFGSGLIVCAFWVVLLAAIAMPLWLSHTMFAVMGLATAGFSLTWACAKEVNPPQLSGMSTSVTNMGGFLAAALMQPAVGFVMDLGWDGTMIGGVRQYGEQTFMLGIGVIAALAVLGTVASLFVRETGCRNVWKAS